MSRISRSREQLRSRLKAIGYEALALLEEPVKAPLRIRAGDRQHIATLTVAPRGHQEEPAQVGSWLSPLEAAICLTLHGGVSLQGKQIAARISQPYDVRLQMILRNLRDRGILRHENGEGYSLSATSD